MWRERIFRRDVLLYIALPAFLFLVLALVILPDFEILYDDFLDSQMIRDNLQLAYDQLTVGEVPAAEIKRRIVFEYENYGTFFNLVAHPVQLFFAGPDILHFESMEVRRYVVFFFAFIGCLALARAIYQVTRSRYSLTLTLAVTALLPLYFFYAFSNAKDIPFAVMMTFVSLVGARSINIILNEPSPRKPLHAAMLTGLAIGLCASVRLGGLASGFYWCVALCALAVFHHSFSLRKFTLATLLAGGVAFIVVWVLHPVSYYHPIAWMTEALTYQAHHPYKASTLTDGEWIYSLQTPWYCLPKWLFAKIPLLWQFLCVVGIIHAVATFRRREVRAQALITLFLLQLLLLPLVAILGGSHFFGDGRHFLFIYPPVVFFSAMAIVWLASLPRREAALALIGVAALSAKIAWDMFLLHPLEQAYLVEPLRHNIAQNWSSTVDTKEAIGWFGQHTEAQEILVDMPWANTWRFVNFYSGRKIRVYNTRQLEKVRRPFYFLDYGDYPPPEGKMFQHCEVLYRVIRPLGPEQLTFSTIKHCL